MFRALRTLPLHQIRSGRTYSTKGPKNRFNLLKARENRAKVHEKWHELQERIRQQDAKKMFNEWRRTHMLKLVVGGAVLGAGLAGFAAYRYLRRHPSTVERLIVGNVISAFNAAASFKARQAVYHSLPEFTMPASATPPDVSIGDDESALQLWAETVDELISTYDSSWLVVAKGRMRKRLIEEILEFEDLGGRLTALTSLLPPSPELDVLIEEQLTNYLGSGKWLDKDILQACTPSNLDIPNELLTKHMIPTIAFFPGPTDQLVLLLAGKRTSKQLVDSLSSSSNVDSTKLMRVLGSMKEHFDTLHPKMQTNVLNWSLATAIGSLPQLQPIQGVSPYELYVRGIESNLIRPLKKDARITNDILQEVKSIFLALPPDIQGRILLTGIVNPSMDTAELVTALLSAGGIVAVKLAQMLAEHPKMPKEYRILLGSLRDSNEPMSPGMFWRQIPPAIRKKITHLGPRLGTGSVKQVHLARYTNSKNKSEILECAVACLRSGVEDEALASIDALQTSEELGPVAKRLGRLIYGEFNLFDEGEALLQFAETPIGTHKLFRVVDVIHHSPKCIVEEAANGVTVATALDEAGDSSSALKETKDVLVEYHRAVFDAFVNHGLIHSDIHLGNAVWTTQPNGNQGFALFDVGQFEKINQADTKALLWLLASISSQQRRRTIRSVALTHMSRVCHLAEETPGETLKEQLAKSYSEAIQPYADGTYPDQREAFMLFLRAAENNKVVLPKGSFALAKMIDGMISQQEWYNLVPVAEDSIEGFLRKSITWSETATIAEQSAREWLRPTSIKKQNEDQILVKSDSPAVGEAKKTDLDLQLEVATKIQEEARETISSSAQSTGHVTVANLSDHNIKLPNSFA